MFFQECIHSCSNQECPSQWTLLRALHVHVVTDATFKGVFAYGNYSVLSKEIIRSMGQDDVQ